MLSPRGIRGDSRHNGIGKDYGRRLEEDAIDNPQQGRQRLHQTHARGVSAKIGDRENRGGAPAYPIKQGAPPLLRQASPSLGEWSADRSGPYPIPESELPGI